ncbi:unnamed protein product [marine sediment metagenome]|uniref:Uncharacterized protein n=1 Tax=marine sediment metagenome TaxID=412755 RepID=X1I623_9ZZZZ
MAGNTRGKLKEEFEGIHKNFDWIIVHCQRSVVMIKHHKPTLTVAIQELGKACDNLDKLAQNIYGKL